MNDKPTLTVKVEGDSSITLDLWDWFHQSYIEPLRYETEPGDDAAEQARAELMDQRREFWQAVAYEYLMLMTTSVEYHTSQYTHPRILKLREWFFTAPDAPALLRHVVGEAIEAQRQAEQKVEKLTTFIRTQEERHKEDWTTIFAFLRELLGSAAYRLPRLRGMERSYEVGSWVAPADIEQVLADLQPPAKRCEVFLYTPAEDYRLSDEENAQRMNERIAEILAQGWTLSHTLAPRFHSREYLVFVREPGDGTPA